MQNNLLKFSVRSIVQSLFLLLIGAYLIFTPSLNLLAFDEKRSIELLLISLALLNTCVASNPTSDSLYFNLAGRQQRVLVVIMLLLVLSCLFAADRNRAFLEASLYLGLFFFYLTIGNIATQKKSGFSTIFFITLSVSALLYQTNFFSAFLASFLENIPLQWPEPFSGFSNVRFFNQYQIWSINLLALPLLLYPKLDKRLLILLKIIAIGWAVLLFASGSRGAIGSVFIAMILTLIIFKNHAKPLLKLNSLILLAGAIAYLLLFKLIPSLLNNQVTVGWRSIEQLGHTNDRIALWQFAIQYIIGNPWLGIGPMHYAYYPGPTNAHPHNSLLQWACEMGIPSTLLVILLVFSGLYSWVKKFYRLTNSESLYVPSHLWVGLFCTLCSGLIYSLVSGVIVMPLSQIMMALIIGWMLGIYFQDQQSKPVSQLQHIGFMLLAGATLITLTYTVLPSLLPRLNSYADLPYQDYPITTPRFWQIGGIPH